MGINIIDNTGKRKNTANDMGIKIIDNTGQEQTPPAGSGSSDTVKRIFRGGGPTDDYNFIRLTGGTPLKRSDIVFRGGKP